MDKVLIREDNKNHEMSKFKNISEGEGLSTPAQTKL